MAAGAYAEALIGVGDLESARQVATAGYELNTSQERGLENCAFRSGRALALAEAALGDDFDISGFHDAVLSGGAVPLSVLERRIDTWISQQ